MIRMAGGRKKKFLSVLNVIRLFQVLLSLGVIVAVHCMVFVLRKFIVKKGLTNLMN